MPRSGHCMDTQSQRTHTQKAVHDNSRWASLLISPLSSHKCGEHSCTHASRTTVLTTHGDQRGKHGRASAPDALVRHEPTANVSAVLRVGLGAEQRVGSMLAGGSSQLSGLSDQKTSSDALIQHCNLQESVFLFICTIITNSSFKRTVKSQNSANCKFCFSMNKMKVKMTLTCSDFLFIGKSVARSCTGEEMDRIDH